MTLSAPIAGALAGLVATAPMTAFMAAAHRALPIWERYPLPPRRIAMRLAGAVGLRHQLDEPQRQGLTLASHFGYGAVGGALFAALAQTAGATGPLSGSLFGLGVWAISYLGWLPAARVLPPATKHPIERTLLMVAAHLIWGACLGWLTALLAPKSAPAGAAPG